MEQQEHTPPAVDWFLRDIIDIAEMGAELPVTLLVSGAIVSGTLIGGKTYFKELGDSLITAASDTENDLTGSIGKSWKSYAELYEKPAGAPDDWKLPPANYIHLRNARYFAPGVGGLPTNQGVMWRARLSTVDGFSWGALKTD